ARIEVRNALEPWHVLGEEATQAGTARYVDSSVERIEVRAIGLDPERYTIAVNRAALPLRQAAGRDVRVGGVRFRAWCPPHALHEELGARRGVEIWIGAEPTFTRPDSLEAAWTSASAGDDKLARAHALASELADRLPGAAVSRVIGRQFPDEDHPRFAFGV